MSNQKTDSQKNEEEDINQSSSSKDSQQKTSYTFYGSKLFVKCFGWFIFITFINILLAGIFGYFYHYKPAREEYERISARILEDNGQLMVETYEKQGNLSSFRYRGYGNIWLFDNNLNKIFEGLKNRSDSNIKAVNEAIPFKNSEKTIRKADSNSSFPPDRPNDFYEPNNIGRGPQPPPPPPPPPDVQGNHNGEKFTVEVKPPQNRFFKLRYKAFYKENEDKILDFAKKLLNAKDTEIMQIGDESFFGCMINSDTDKKYVAIIHIPREIPNRNKYIFINQTKNMSPLLLIVCAVLCFLMARYLAKPIIELQEASRKFAKGDFSHKITKEAMTRYDEIGDLASDFNNMALKIETLINSQKRLFNDISHELRSPLARMQVSIELLQMKVADSEKSLVNRLEKDVNRMNALIEELLQFTKLENKQISSNIEEIDLGKALENVCADAEFENKNKHKGVRLEIKQECSIKGNPTLLERAFENIIRNGLRFTPENTVVEVSLEKIDNKAVIKISDKGPGVPEDQLKKIFAPFYCINTDRNPQKGGVGLGLPIALKAIQIHKGTIVMSNKSEGGLLATIELPLE